MIHFIGGILSIFLFLNVRYDIKHMCFQMFLRQTKLHNILRNFLFSWGGFSCHLLITVHCYMAQDKNHQLLKLWLSKY